MINPDLTFAALADHTRRAILARLAQSEATVLELAEPFPISQPAVSRHLRILEEAGLITRRVEGSRRPCRLATGALEEVEAWLAQLRRAMEASYGRLDALLAEELAAAGAPPKDPKKKKKRKKHRKDR